MYRLRLEIFRTSGNPDVLAARFGRLESPVRVTDQPRALTPKDIGADGSFCVTNAFAFLESSLDTDSIDDGVDLTIVR